MKKLPLTLALLMLTLSLAMLLWAFLPPAFETRTLPLLPADLQRPTSLVWMAV